ncbi:soluble lytic murein transglycosylase-like protein [Neorhizobium galegae]|nr:soluble lytic murein transglycosylase-like protein [Neorhizobium galegae]
MAITRILGCNAVVAFAICGAVSGCSSVETASKKTAADTEQSAELASAEAPSAGQATGQQPATKTGRISIAAAAAASAAASGPVEAPAGTTTVVAEKGGRVHTVTLPTGQSALAAQNDAVRAALAQASEMPVVTPALAVAPTSIQTTGAMEAINVATTTAHTMTEPVSATPLAKTSQEIAPTLQTAALRSTQKPAEKPAGIPPEFSASYAAIPTPRPRPAPSSTSSMLAYASPAQPLSSVSNDFFPPAPGAPVPATAEASTPTLNKLIKRYAGMYGVPESLVHRVVHRESRYDPKAYNKRGYFGLMQIKYSTAKSMGYSGTPEGLLDAETNLKYAIKYLRGAWLVADNEPDDAIGLYARGYYYDAKRKDMLNVLK